MWFVLRPLIFYLESFVFRYIPLARGELCVCLCVCWGGGLAGILSSTAKYVVELSCWLRISEGKWKSTTDALSFSTSSVFYYTVTWSSFAWVLMQQLYPPSCLCITYERLFQTSCCVLSVRLTASSLAPAWHPLRSRVWSFHLPGAKWMPVIVVLVG